jgi:hypothetical protein
MQGGGGGGGGDGDGGGNINFFREDGPMLCFSSSHHQDAIVESLGFTYDCDIIITNCNVSKYISPIAGSPCIYTTFIRVPGATLGFIHKLEEITTGFRGNVLVVDPRMTEQAFRAARVHFAANYFTVDTAAALEVLMNIPMTTAQKDHIENAVFSVFTTTRNRRRVGMRPAISSARLPPRQYRQNRMINSFYAAASRHGNAAPPPMPPHDMMLGTGIVFHDGGGGGDRHYERFMRFPQAPPIIAGDEDAMFNLAQQMSLDAAERMMRLGGGGGGGAARPQRQPDPLPTGWQDILMDPEPCVVGYPECGICMSHKATILFTECGHMTACDACVRRMFTDPTVKSECPLCPRVKKTKIMRPVTSGVTKPDDDDDDDDYGQAPGSKPKKKRHKK